MTQIGPMEIEDAKSIQFDRALKDIAGIVAEVMLAEASRSGKRLDDKVILYGAAGMLGAAYNLAKMGGEECLRGYLDVLRSHQQAIEDMLL